MPGPEEITRRLENAGINYCIVGGLASIAYGRPRLTLDADLVLAINPDQVASLIEAFPSADFYLPPAEVMQAELQRESRGHFNIIHQHSALRADCYLPGRSKLARWELAHRQRLALGSGEAWLEQGAWRAVIQSLRPKRYPAAVYRSRHTERPPNRKTETPDSPLRPPAIRPLR